MTDTAPWFWQPSTDRMVWSQGLYRMLGVSMTALPAPSLADLLAHVAQEHRDRVLTALQRVPQTGAALRMTTSLLGKATNPASSSGGSLELCAESASGGVLGWISPVTLPAGDTPSTANAGGRSASQRSADAGSDSLAVLAGGVAHDFNNLLVGIMGNLDLARYSDALPRDTALHLSAAMQAAERAAELCRQLLAFSGRGPSRFETVDVNARMRRITSLLIGSLPRHAVLDLHLASEPLPANIDTGQFTQLLINLLTNAAEATPSGGHVRLRTQWREAGAVLPGELFIAGEPVTERCVAIAIEDDGAGMDPALQQRLCEPFFSTKGAGRGLGLAAAQGIVRNHGGALTLRSVPHQGTCVIVLLPTSGSPRPALTASAPPVRTRTILVVDDEPTVRDVMRLQLEKLGYSTRALANGRDCIEHVVRHRGEIDAVVLDQTMPVMGGTEAYNRLREIAPELPIILTTGFGQDNIAGLIDTDRHALFLPKPYALNRLQAALQELLGE